MGTAVDLLAELIRIPSVNPTAADARSAAAGDGEGAVAEVLRGRLVDAGLETTVLTSPAGRPSLVARLPGPTDVAPLVLLSHTDVVPVETSAWRHDPFGGEIVDGELWGRGALDMKGIAVLHAEAVAALATSQRTPTREVIVAAVADEEAGGAEGTRWLLHDQPERLGFRDDGPRPEALGEGAFGLSGLLPRPLLPIVVGEKAPLVVRAVVTGESGHGSLPPDRQAIRELTRFVDAVAGPRPARIHPVTRDLFAALAAGADGARALALRLLAGHVGPAAVRALTPLLRAHADVLGHLVADTITPTRLAGGYAANVVPGEAEVTLDCRLLPDTDPGEVLAQLRSAGGDRVELDVLQRSSSPVSPQGALYHHLAAISAALPDGPVVAPSLTTGTTDLRFLRAAGASAYGWVPLVLTPELLGTFHGHDERVPVDGFERALTATVDLVRRAAS
jgi:acetylornithine deacetylase/succinyl-diaminopimelate desuccinylase-like protein